MNTTPRVLAFIPARGGSKRIPRKNIIDFFGKPMIAYTIERAFEAKIFDLVHVSTDDDEIANTAQRYGADVSFRRPTHLSDDHAPLFPAMRWTLQQFSKAGRKFDCLFTLFPCAPLLEATDLVGALKVFTAHGGKRNLLSVARSPVPAEWFYHMDPSGRLIPLHPGAAFIRSQDLKSAYFETGTFTIFFAKWLLAENAKQDDTNYVAFEIPMDRAIDIDTPEDLERARRLYAQKVQQT